MNTAKRRHDEDRDLVDFIKSCPLFGVQSEEVIGQLLSFSEIQSFAPGAKILVEGQRNERLYILMAGTVAVTVAGERLAVMNRPGDIFGEMSVVTERPCAATVVAQTEVKAFAVSVAEIARLAPTDARALEAMLYRIYAVILADKLERTNASAKQVEATSQQAAAARDALAKAQAGLEQTVEERTRALEEQMRSLEAANAELETQKEALLASRQMLEEQARARARTLERIADVHRTHVAALRDRLATMANATALTEGSLDGLRTSLVGLSAGFAPLLTLHSAEKAWRGQRLVLASRDRRSRLMARAALSGTGADLKVFSFGDDVRKAMQQSQVDLLCVGEELLDVAKTGAASNLPVLVWTPMLSPELLATLRASPPANLLTSHPTDRLFSVRALLASLGKLAAKDVFGIENYLLWGSEIQTRTIKGSEHRWELMSEMEERLRTLGLREPLIVRCSSVAEELMTNAIYDAPTDDQGKPLFQHVPRTEAVTLPTGRTATLRYACDGTVVALAVEDPFGGLSVETMLQYLDRCFRNQEALPVEGKTGAGLGLFQIIGSADFVGFQVLPGRRTEVITLFRVDGEPAADGAVAAVQFLTAR